MQWNIVYAKLLLLTQDSFSVLLFLSARYDFSSRVPGQSHAFYKIALDLGECVSNTNMLYLLCLSVTVLI